MSVSGCLSGDSEHKPLITERSLVLSPRGNMESGPLQLILCLYVGSLPDEPFYDTLAAVARRKVQGREARLVLRVVRQRMQHRQRSELRRNYQCLVRVSIRASPTPTFP